MEPVRISSYFDILGQTQKAYGRLLEPVCKKWDLTRNELDVLLFLCNNPSFDRAADIVSHRGMTKSHVSLSVASLADRKLLERHFSAADRRTAHLKLTREGSAIAGEAREAQKTFFASLYAGISEEEFHLWEQITDKIRENIAELNKKQTNP